MKLIGPNIYSTFEEQIILFSMDPNKPQTIASRATLTLAISFNQQHTSFVIDPEDDPSYEDFWQFALGLFKITADEEIFIYAVPKDHSSHVRFCNRLFESVVANAQNSAGNSRISLRIFSACDFLVWDGVAGDRTKITKIPKTSGATKHGSRGPRPAHGSRGHKTGTATADPTSLVQSTPLQVVPKVVPKVVEPPKQKKSIYAADIDLFNSNYQVRSLPHNVFIDTNYTTSLPFEYKGGDKYSISLILKATGTENVGKDFSLSKIAGNGSPNSFSLPLLKPQVTRTISITVEMTGNEEYSLWAVKKSSGEWIGNILSITVLKMQTKLLIKTIEFAQASKDLSQFYWEK